MRPIHRLEVHLGIPVGVVQHNDVGSSQIDSEAAGSGGEQEDKLLRVLLVERVDGVLAVIPGCVTVDPAVLVAFVQAVILQYVEHASHLREDEHAAVPLLQLRQQFVEEDELAAVLDQVIARDERRPRLRPLEQVRVVAALSELHDDVEEARALRPAVDGLDVLLQEGRVVLLLHRAHADLEDRLLLWREPALHVALDTPKQERPQNLVQLLDDLRLALAPDADAKPLVKLLAAREDLGQEEVEEGPQLVQVVLQRRPCDEEPVVCVHHPHHPGEDGVLVLDAVGLVDDDISPVELLEKVLLLDDHLKGSDTDIKLPRNKFHGLGPLPLLRVAMELDRADDGAPPPELVQPVVEGRLGHEHEVGPRDAAVLVEVPQQGDGLQRFAEAHLVCQNAVDAVVVQVDEPVEPLHLVLAHGAKADAARLHGEAVRLIAKVVRLVFEQVRVLLLLGVLASVAARAL
mmetsp:Transcript_32858/g.77904  ORF Transcript_32858/g.77904 Transcript_32858/m.77904 type:complete len:460 (-) Transcript_32858:740-2119(-)